MAGGTTTFMEMPNTNPQAVTIDELEKKYKRAADCSLANYSFFMGGTNHKGYTLHGLYGVAHNTWFGLRYNSYNQISGLPLAIDSVNLDFNARF